MWDVKSGELENTLVHHCEAVLHLRFDNGLMVTCSKVCVICVYNHCQGCHSSGNPGKVGDFFFWKTPRTLLYQKIRIKHVQYVDKIIIEPYEIM